MKTIKLESLILLALLMGPQIIWGQVKDAPLKFTNTSGLYGLTDKIEGMPIVTTSDFDFNFLFSDPNMCGKDDKYGDLTSILKTGECFDAKLNREQGTGEGYLISEEVLLEADEQVCNCLKTDKNTKIAERMNLSHKEQFLASNNKISESINENLKNLKGTIESLRDSMLFQADLLFRDNNGPQEDVNKLVTFYSGGFVTSSFNSGQGRQLFNGMGGRLKDFGLQQHKRNATLMDHFSAVGGAKKQANAQLEKNIEEALQNTKIDPPNVELIAQPTFEEGQCVGPKEFIAKNQTPSENEFYLELASEKFDETRWNYEILEQKLIALSADPKAHENEIKKLEMRMRYLNRNPFIKNFFAASEDTDKYIKDFTGGSKEVENKFRSTSSQFIKNKKAELFAIIKTQLSPSDKSCGKIPSGCKKEVIKNYGKFKELTNNFFKDEKVGLITNAQVQRFMFDEIDKFKSDPLSVSDEIVSYKQEDIEKFVYKKTHFDPSQCHNRSPASSGEGYSYDLVSCIDAYGLYCSTLAIAKENHLKNIKDPRSAVKKLAKETKEFFSPKIDENPELKKFNEEFCKTPRLAKDGSGHKSFLEFKDSYCEKNRSNSACQKATFENIAQLREMYRQNYSFSSFGDEKSRVRAADHETFDTWNMGIKDTSIMVATAVAGGHNAEFPSSLEQLIRDFSISGFEGSKEAQTFEEAGMFSNLVNVVSDTKLRPSTISSFDSSYEDVNNYSNLPSFTQTALDEPKIDQLTTFQKEEILSQWREELADFKKENQENSTSDRSAEAGLRAKIEALETLLAQQQKLTEDQYRLLNTAISNQKIPEAPKAATNTQPSNNAEKEAMEKVRVRSNSGFTTTALANGTLSDDTMRGPASIKDQTSSNSSSASASTQRASSSSGARASADSVAREEAKLVNLRRFPDGSITIESTTKGGQLAPNAITVPVSDEQYRLLQSNPGALSLSQIEKSIPKEQLAELEKSGQIILVLQNGENPPFEVKVEKKDNKLVYQLQDTKGNKVNPIQRVYTRRALELELKIE